MCSAQNSFRMRRLFAFLFFCGIWLQYGFSQMLVAHRNVVPDGYSFWVSTPPDYDSSDAAKPIILFLHGNSLCGRDLERVRRYGPLHAQAMGRQIDAVIVAPQNPGGPWNAEKVWHTLQWAMEHYPGDSNRLYVIGMSLGGYGTVNFVGSYPDKVAAAMALCGGGWLTDYCGLTRVPFWIMHGTADRAVGISQSLKVVNAMVACGDTSRLLFTRLKGAGHAHLAKAFYIPETYQWLFAHSLADSGRCVNRQVTIGMAELDKAYRNIDRSANNLVVRNYRQEQDSTLQGAGDADSVVRAADPQPQAAAVYHTVRKGDTLGAIARKYHTSVAALCRLNRIKETTLLQIGQRLRVR